MLSSKSVFVELALKNEDVLKHSTSCRTLEDLTRELKGMGFNLSRSGTYLRLTADKSQCTTALLRDESVADILPPGRAIVQLQNTYAEQPGDEVVAAISCKASGTAEALLEQPCVGMVTISYNRSADKEAVMVQLLQTATEQHRDEVVADISCDTSLNMGAVVEQSSDELVTVKSHDMSATKEAVVIESLYNDAEQHGDEVIADISRNAPLTAGAVVEQFF